MANLKLDDLTKTDRHITETKAHIARHREVIERLARGGHPVNLSVELLNALENALDALERRRAIILKQRKLLP